AEAGLFTEALSILLENSASADTLTHTAVDSIEPRPFSVHRRISSGIDYYRLEDVDTGAMTQEVLNDYRRLTETPLSIWLRAKISIRPMLPALDEITPEAYISEKKGRFETAVRFILPGNTVRVEPSLKVEKWFKSGAGSDTASDASYAPFSKQDSDMGGGYCRILLAPPSKPDAKIRFTIPLSVHGEYYRNDRPGYESFIEYGFSPEMEMTLGTLLSHLRIFGDVKYKDYYRKVSDSPDYIGMSGSFEGMFHRNKTSGILGTVWMGNRYLRTSDHLSIDRIEISMRGEHSFEAPFQASLLFKGIYERESRTPDTGTGKSVISGSGIMAASGLDCVLQSKRFRFGPELLLERHFSSVAKNPVWEAKSTVEPEIHAIWSGETIDATLRTAFRSENIDEEFENSSKADNRSFRGGVEVLVAPLSFLTASLILDYQYRVYAPFNTDARISENITLSMNVTLKW
ncbi:MAG: hypothetical protein PVI26_01945, partial [Chitinispirillia bacterium]